LKKLSENLYLSSKGNMRELVNPKLTNDDIVCGSAALIWSQDIAANDHLWDLASFATKRIRELRNENYGLKWWVELSNGIMPQPYSIMSSSMGIVSLNESQFKRLRIRDLRFLGSAYEVQFESVACMTHAITFRDRFTFNFSYTYPALTREWAKNFSENMTKVLKLFSSSIKETNPSVSEILCELKKFSLNK
jgi:hypothetical protein